MLFKTSKAELKSILRWHVGCRVGFGGRKRAEM